MIKAGFIAGGTKSSIDELYAEMSFPDQAYGSIVDEVYAEVAIGAPEYSSTLDEIFVEISLTSSL